MGSATVERHYLKCENRTLLGAENLQRARGVDMVVLDDAECTEMMTQFIAHQPSLWNEDIGVPD